MTARTAGGLHARVFASMFPQEVVGLVLVDPTPGRSVPMVGSGNGWAAS